MQALIKKLTIPSVSNLMSINTKKQKTNHCHGVNHAENHLSSLRENECQTFQIQKIKTYINAES